MIAEINIMAYLDLKSIAIMLDLIPCFVFVYMFLGTFFNKINSCSHSVTCHHAICIAGENVANDKIFKRRWTDAVAVGMTTS